MKKHIIKIIGLILCTILSIINFSEPAQLLKDTASSVYYVDESEKNDMLHSLNSVFFKTELETPVSTSSDERLNSSSEITVSLFGLLPIKTVTLSHKDDIILIPSGHSVGISIDIDGLLVVGTGEVTTDSSGNSVPSPAHSAGIKTGDYIISANGKVLTDSESLSDICGSCNGKITLTIKRNGIIKDIDVTPAFDTRTNTYKLGIWVREDTAGIGTLSYYDPQKKTFAALGHPVTDIDTGSIFPVKSGNISECNIVGINKGISGSPGELTGMFSSAGKKHGTIQRNTSYGIFGIMTDTSGIEFIYPDGIPLAYPDEVHTGNATILSTVSNGNAQEYTCRIVKTVSQSKPSVKSMVVEITDKELISKTGGIVQGMSGSPIIQDGKIVGVVTHVMINNPLRGYGIYAYWMYVS